jgi:hypothetical protein
MGCGCGGRRAVRNVAGTNGTRPIVTPSQRSIQGGLAAAKSPTELRALSKDQQTKSPAGMNKERLALEKKRRDTILKKFGK